MKLEQLRAFCAVVEAGGFHAASELLYRSQSAVSIAVGKLEEELGVTLFDRSGYRIALTPAGQQLYGKARAILQRSEEMLNMAAHLARGEEPELALAITAIAPVERILEVIRTISETSPATRMSLQIENLSGTVERLLDREVDFAVTDHFLPVPETEAVRLTSIDMVPVISADFPLATRHPAITLRDMEPYVQVVVRDTSRHLPKQTVGVVEGAPQWLVNDFDMKKRMILSGAGWGRMPRHRITEELADGRLLQLSGRGLETMTADIYLMRRLDDAMGPVGEQLWQMLQQCCPAKS